MIQYFCKNIKFITYLIRGIIYEKTLISTILATALISTMIATVANASVTEDNILINLNSSVETNIEEIDYASMISSIQLPVLVENLKTYMEENPNLTDEEINNYFKNLIIQNYDESLVALDNISMYAYDYANALPIVSSRLGTNEKKVFNSNPAKGVLVLSNAQAAITMTSQHWKNTHEYHNDNADAFRHTLWNAYNAHDCGVSYAKQFADAHEKDNPNDALENQMDLFNNALGRTIGSRSYSGNSSQVSYAIRQAVLKAVKNGEARRFVGSDIGTKNTLQKTNSNGIK